MSIIPDLLAEIDAFLAERGVAETTFGRHAVNDGKFLGRLRAGGGITVAMVDRVRAYMAAERSKGGDREAARRRVTEPVAETTTAEGS